MLRLSGDSALEIAFQMAPRVSELKHGRAITAWIRRPDGSRLDQVILTSFHAPHSFTGENTVEIGCHGNPLIVDQIVDLALGYGAQMARPGEFTRQAVLNGKMSFLKAEALNELIHAGSTDGINLAQKGLVGNIDVHELELRTSLLDIAAELEAKMDYPQEDLSFDSDEEVVQALRSIASDARQTAKSYQKNRVRLNGANVVILGPVNAGKSSLFNNLVGQKRAIVSDKPGTTRDIVERRILLDGLEVCFFDTAGARFDSNDPIENEGIQMGLELAQEADLCLFLCPAHCDLGVVEQLKMELSDKPSLTIATHADVCSVPLFKYDVLVSNIDKTGISDLGLKIRTVLGINETSENNRVVLSQRQQSLFLSIAEHVELSAVALNGFLGPAVATEEITLALELLASLRGDSAREQILDTLFAKFCIGK